MIVVGPWRSLAAVAALLLAAAPAAAQMDVAADICAAIDLAPPAAAGGLIAPLLSASFGARNNVETAENRVRFLHFLVSDQTRQAAAIEAEIAEMRYGSRSPAALDAEVAAAEARRAQRADALAVLIAGRRRLEALERQAQADPSAVEPAALDRARAAVAQLEQDLPGAPLNVMDHQIASAQAAAASRRAEIAALEDRRRQALETKARQEAEIQAIWASLPGLQAVADQYRAALAQVWRCYGQRIAEAAPPPAPVASPPVVMAPPPMVMAPAPHIVAPPPRVSIPIVAPLPPPVIVDRPPLRHRPRVDGPDYRYPGSPPPPRMSGPPPRHPPPVRTHRPAPASGGMQQHNKPRTQPAAPSGGGMQQHVKPGTQSSASPPPGRSSGPNRKGGLAAPASDGSARE